jgi:hypothetical protein
MRLITLLGALIFSFNAMAANSVTSDVTNQGAVKNWHIMLDANHVLASREDQVAETNFTAFFDYQLNPSHSFRVLQAPTKLYEVAEGQNEFQASDTILYHFWNTGLSTGPTRYRWVTSVGLPTSEEAQDNNKVATITGTLQANTLLAGKFLISARPFLRYNWYEYKTSPGGTPLAAFVYGANLVTSYQLTTKFSLNASAGYSWLNNYSSQFDNSTVGISTGNQQGRYFLGAGGNYEVTDKFSVYFNYSHGDIFIKDGRYELFAYDPQLSRVGVGATLYF